MQRPQLIAIVSLAIGCAQPLYPLPLIQNCEAARAAVARDRLSCQEDVADGLPSCFDDHVRCDLRAACEGAQPNTCLACWDELFVPNGSARSLVVYRGFACAALLDAGVDGSTGATDAATP